MRTIMVAVVALLSIGASARPQAYMFEAVSSSLNDYNYGRDAAERTAVFARSEADFAKARIFISEKVRGQWTKPAPISFTDARYSDSDPWLTPDGRALYFVSNRPVSGVAAKADLDIWRSERVAGGWSAPEHLGDVNSAGPELGVELHDGVLYFSSARKGGRGGLDIYTSNLVGGKFQAPRLIDGPFNSSASDSDFTISRDGRLAAFWRSDGDKGVLHLSRRLGDEWSQPVALPSAFSPGSFNFTPHFSNDGRSLWFASTAVHAGQVPEMADIFVAKLPAMPK